ncbi:DNA-3-methyladenine glycosylase II NDAI_0B03050 [Naumovozyma dairenensis CBS 421]|uniref:HhH-GPD domain-containing protein n=1 Tax=Naumovozyma dairenensis (strain ATCC 10597 / BCRC 20456 / CBS 421 / NBRC 0211 / NRRL Y-12639) TaxID=1071378 RepID=G0W6C9_NAUDC|nr:hypothetical protein NDAI_0B03050 [Naumovozyma dairenensis CBS 421]CCD23340.1 hypothetical protein NDAI_0B03050 [Naumovozyma dairenensis CBS 421]
MSHQGKVGIIYIYISICKCYVTKKKFISSTTFALEVRLKIIWHIFQTKYPRIMTKRTIAEVELEDSTIKNEDTQAETKVLKVDAKIDLPSEIPKEFALKHIEEFNKACQYIIKVDPTLLEPLLIHEAPLYLLTSEADNTLQSYFARLASVIVAQQLSGHAAKSIKKKFIEHFDNKFPTYKDLYHDLKDDDERKQILACGLSQRKMTYLDSLTTYFYENEENIRKLFDGKDNDQEIIDELVKNIKGIGPWSAKMFLITGLRRFDVFAAEDLGIARGFSKYLSDKPELVKSLISTRGVIKKSKIKHKKVNWKIYDDDIMEKCAERFAPYRSVFMFILWRMSNTHLDAVIKNENDFARGHQ